MGDFFLRPTAENLTYIFSLDSSPPVFTIMSVFSASSFDLGAEPAVELDGHLLAHLSPAARKLRDRFREVVGFRRTIIHELGHAVIAVHLKQPLRTVTIEANGKLAGACSYAIQPQDLGNNALTAAQAIATAGAKAAVLNALVGHEMSHIETACSIDSDHDEYRLDEDMLRAYARYLQIPSAAFALWREEQMHTAFVILRRPQIWKALMKLAKELKSQQTLTGDRVREVLEEYPEATV